MLLTKVPTISLDSVDVRTIADLLSINNCFRKSYYLYIAMNGKSAILTQR